MSLSEIQTKQIADQLAELTARINRMRETATTGPERIGKLSEAGFHLEALMIHAQMIEQILKLILGSYASKRRILKIRGENDPYDHIKLEDHDGETLGELINVFKKVTGSSSLVQKLFRFNNLRIQVVHHIFDGAKEIQPLEKEAGEYAGSIELKEMVDGLYAAHQKVRKEVMDFANS